MTAEQWFTAISTFGLATGLLLGMLFGLFKLGRMVIERLFVPMAQAHINFMNVASSNMEKITTNLDVLTKAQTDICRYPPKDC